MLILKMLFSSPKRSKTLDLYLMNLDFSYHFGMENPILQKFLKTESGTGGDSRTVEKTEFHSRIKTVPLESKF